MQVDERVAGMTEIEAKEALLWLLHKACPLGGDIWDNCEVFPCRATCEECLLDQAKEAGQ